MHELMEHLNHIMSNRTRRRHFFSGLALALTLILGILFGTASFVSVVCKDLKIHPVGVYIAILALVLCGFSGHLAKKLHPRKGKRRDKIKRTIQYTSLVICAGGLLLAILV